MTRPPPLLRVRGITKRFFGITALEDVHFDIERGVIHALVGENGAGKSTLMKCMVGVHVPDAGHFELDGRRVRIHSPSDATQAGIDIVYQEIEVAPNLTAAENIFLAREPTRRGRLDYPTMIRRSRELLDRLGVRFPVDVPVERLTLAERQLVQIARAISIDTRLLILDEPTSALSDNESEHLFEILESLRDQGTTILYVSHKLDEVFRLADSVTVLRDGHHVGTHPRSELTRHRLITLMTGGMPPLSDQERSDRRDREEQPILSVDRLCGGRIVQFRDVSLQLFAGEVVGLFGIVGAGRTELSRALFGLAPITSGTIRCADTVVERPSPRTMVDRGIALVPADRKNHGLILGMSCLWNLTLPVVRRLCRGGWIRTSLEHEVAGEMVDTLNIVTRSLDAAVQNLSGGNQQKVVIGKWLITRPRVLILDEPTRGIDVAAKREVHNLIRRLASDGLSVLLITSEIEEALELADRLLVMREGTIVADLDPKTTGKHEVLSRAMP